MIEKTILDYLKNQLTNVPVYMEIPANPPQKYCLVEKTGSSVSDYIHTATIVIQSVAVSLYEAAILNETVKTAMDSAISQASICKCKLNSDYNFTDTEKKKYRYQCVYDIVHN